MSIQTQINRISGNVGAAFVALAEVGVTVPAGANSDNLAELIRGANIETWTLTLEDGSTVEKVVHLG